MPWGKILKYFFSGYEDTLVFVIDYIAAGYSLRP